MLLRKSLLAAFLLFLALAPHVQLALNGGGKEEGRLPFAFETELISIPKAHAEEGDPFFLSDLGQKFFTGLLDAFTVINWLALSAVQALLSPDVIFGQKLDPTTGAPSPTGIRTMELILRNIWVTSRNIVNGIFAFILLFAGIYLIVKADSGAMTNIKSGAKNFVLAVILVNFSWFFPRVILDISSVLTSVIYQLPALVDPRLPCIGEPGPDGKPGTTDDIHCRYVWRVHLFPTMGECAPGMPPSPTCIRPVADNPALPPQQWGKSYWDFVDIFYAKWETVATTGEFEDYTTGDTVPVSGADVIVNGLAVNFAKIPSFALIDFKDMWLRLGAARGAEETATAFLKFFIELIMHVILSAAVGLALLALAAVLVVRIAVLWLTIAFMPFIFIGFALRGPGGTGELGAGEAQAPNIWKTFLSYAFLPAIVAIPFAIGFTLMSQLYYMKAMTIPLPIHGMDTILPKGVDSFHELLWMIMAIAIIWFSVFTILEKDKIAGGIVKGIRGIGTTAVKAAGYGALSLPIIPQPGGGRIGPLQLFDRLKRLPEKIRFPDIAGGAGGGAPAPPPMERVIRASEGLNQRQFEELKNILLRTNAGNAPSQLNEFAEKLARLSPLLNAAQARGLAMNEHALREFLSKAATEGKITEVEKSDMLRHAEHFQALGGGGVAAGAAAQTTNMRLNIADLKNKGIGEIIEGIKESHVRGERVIDDLKQAEAGLRDRDRPKSEEIGQLHRDLQDIKNALVTKSEESDNTEIKSALGNDLLTRRGASIEQLIQLMRMNR